MTLVRLSILNKSIQFSCLSSLVVCWGLISSSNASSFSLSKISDPNITQIPSNSRVILSQVLNPRSTPNRDRFLQPIPGQFPFPSKEDQKPLDLENTPLESPANPAVDSSSPRPTFLISHIDVVGSTVFESTEFDPITQPLEGRAVTLSDLQAVVETITSLYLSQGYITSKAVLVDQTIVDGVVQIQIIEGTLDKIKVNGNGRLKASYIRDRLQLGIDTPLNSNRLEENLRLLSLDPIFKEVKASLTPGKNLGKSDLVVQVTPAKPWEISVGIDNYSVPSIAPERIGVDFSYYNVSGLGDQVSASYKRGLNFGDFFSSRFKHL